MAKRQKDFFDVLREDSLTQILLTDLKMAQTANKCIVPNCPTKKAKLGYTHYSGLENHCKNIHLFNAEQVNELRVFHGQEAPQNDNSSVAGDASNALSTVQSQLETVTNQMEDLQDEVSDLKTIIDTNAVDAKKASDDAKKASDEVKNMLCAVMQVIISFISLFGF